MIKVYRTTYTDGSIRYTVDKPKLKSANTMTDVTDLIDGRIPQPLGDSRLVSVKGYVAADGMVIRTPKPNVRLNWVGNDVS